MLALHDPLDDVADVIASRREDVLGDLLGLELVVELGRAAELGDPLVDGDRPHLRRPRGDDSLPAEATAGDAGHLLDLAREDARDQRQARDVPARELAPGKRASKRPTSS